MPANFVQIGAFFVNLELVTSIELVFNQDPGQPQQSAGQAAGVRVHFTTGKHQDFLEPQDVREIVEWMRAHKAT